MSESPVADIKGPKGDTGAQGPQGDDGLAATNDVGSTTTGAPGTEASVTNSGDSTNAIYHFTIPRGDTGIGWQAGTDPNDIWNTNSGNVGIGIADPLVRLHTYTTNSGTPATSGSATTGVSARIQSSSVNFDFGTYSAGQCFIQSRLIGDNATNFNLALNPNGGNVGIGTADPATTLDVNGAITLSGGLSLDRVGNEAYILGSESGVSKYQQRTLATGGVRWTSGDSTSEWARINSTGNVLINGTTGDANTALTVYNKGTYTPAILGVSDGASWAASGVSHTDNASAYLLLLQDAGNNYLYSEGTTALRIRTTGAGNIIFDTSNAEAMRIDSSGRVGIGVSPLYGFDLGLGGMNCTDVYNNLAYTGAWTYSRTSANIGYMRLFYTDRFDEYSAAPGTAGANAAIALTYRYQQTTNTHYFYGAVVLPTLLAAGGAAIYADEDGKLTTDAPAAVAAREAYIDNLETVIQDLTARVEALENG